MWFFFFFEVDLCCRLEADDAGCIAAADACKKIYTCFFAPTKYFGLYYSWSAEDSGVLKLYWFLLVVKCLWSTCMY